MPGLYTHTTRAAGTVVTATIYNADHQNHIDNQTPDKTDDWSTDVTQMNLTADPYNAGAGPASLATSLDGEITRLRFQIAQLGKYLNGGVALTQWYYAITNPMTKSVGCRVTNSAAFAYTTAGLKVVTYDTETYDQDGGAVGFHSTSSNTSRLTVPTGIGGKYLITVSGQWASNADTAIRVTTIRLNGTTVIASQGQSVSATNSTFDQCVSVIYALAAADYVEVAVQASVNMNYLGPQATTASVFAIQLLGA